MKIWVDMNGLRTSKHSWKKGHEPQHFDVSHWLRMRTNSEFDDENIGLLAKAQPSLDELAEALSREYQFLAGLQPDERVLARCHGADRGVLLRALDQLPGSQMAHGSCW